MDDGDPAADDALAGSGRQFLDVPVSASDRVVQLHRRLLCGRRPWLVPDDRRR